MIYDDGNGTHLEETVYLAVNYGVQMLDKKLKEARELLDGAEAGERRYKDGTAEALKEVVTAESETYSQYADKRRYFLTQPQIDDINRAVKAMLEAIREFQYAEIAKEVTAFDPLPNEVSFQTVGNDTQQSELNLPDKLGATIDGQHVEISGVTWASDSVYPVKQDGEGKYVFTPFDFQTVKTIGRDIDTPIEQLKLVNGYDHHFCLSDDRLFHRAAVLRGNISGITMTMDTTSPGVQLYTANSLFRRRGKGGAVYVPRCAVCLEPQFPPDAAHHLELPQPLLQAGSLYRHRTVYTFS